MLDDQFSVELKQVIAESRTIAMALGYDYIATVHILLADCRLNHQYSIRNFCFSSDLELEDFIHSKKLGEPIIFAEGLPLTKEAEKMIRSGIDLFKTYKDTKIRPYHFFIAAAQTASEGFLENFKQQENLAQRLEEYYTTIGQIRPATNTRDLTEGKSFFKKLRFRFFR